MNNTTFLTYFTSIIFFKSVNSFKLPIHVTSLAFKFSAFVALLTSLVSLNALANDKPMLNVYTYDSFTAEWGPGPKIKKAFEENCGCQLNFVALDDGASILNRLRLEGKNTKADVMLGLHNNIMEQALRTGLLAEHGINTEKQTKPTAWNDPTFVPFDFGYFSFIYNKERLNNPPKSMQELVARDDISIIYQDPRTSITGQGMLLWIKSIYGDKSGDVWKQLSKKTVTITKGWSESYSMFQKGEADMVLSYSTSPAYHWIAENDRRYQAADFSEGHYAQIELAALVKSSKNKALGQKFLAFMLSDVFQQTMTTFNWMYPVTDIQLPADFEQLTLPSKQLSLPAKQVARELPKWTREWQTALSQ